jgi:hypothetical protein
MGINACPRLPIAVFGGHIKNRKKFFAAVIVFIFVFRMTNTRGYRYFYFSFYFTGSRGRFC